MHCDRHKLLTWNLFLFYISRSPRYMFEFDLLSACSSCFFYPPANEIRFYSFLIWAACSIFHHSPYLLCIRCLLDQKIPSNVSSLNIFHFSLDNSTPEKVLMIFVYQHIILISGSIPYARYNYSACSFLSAIHVYMNFHWFNSVFSSLLAHYFGTLVSLIPLTCLISSFLSQFTFGSVFLLWRKLLFQCDSALPHRIGK